MKKFMLLLSIIVTIVSFSASEKSYASTSDAIEVTDIRLINYSKLYKSVTGAEKYYVGPGVFTLTAGLTVIRDDNAIYFLEFINRKTKTRGYLPVDIRIWDAGLALGIDVFHNTITRVANYNNKTIGQLLGRYYGAAFGLTFPVGARTSAVVNRSGAIVLDVTGSLPGISVTAAFTRYDITTSSSEIRLVNYDYPILESGEGILKITSDTLIKRIR